MLGDLGSFQEVEDNSRLVLEAFRIAPGIPQIIPGALRMFRNVEDSSSLLLGAFRIVPGSSWKSPDHS